MRRQPALVLPLESVLAWRAQGARTAELRRSVRARFYVTPNVGAKGDSSGVALGPEDRKCTPYLTSGPGGTPLLLPLERLVRPHGTARAAFSTSAREATQHS
jgi:hypothetical protein